MLTGIIPGRLKYASGKAALAGAGGYRMVLNPVRNDGEWSSGLSDELEKIWPMTKQEYRKWYLHQKDFKLGSIYCHHIRSDLTIAHIMIIKDEKTLDIEALKNCLTKVGNVALDGRASVHCSKFGLDDDKWALVEPLINEHLIKRGLNVTVYDQA